MMVLLFNVLFVALLGVAWRHTASALRLATVREKQTQRDEGCLHALALAMRRLETGLPPSTPYVCIATIDTRDGPRSFTVTFTQQTEPEKWTIHARPTAAGDPTTEMPDDFAGT